MHSWQKRILAAVLSLITLPGVGHYSLGAARASAYAVTFIASYIAFTCMGAFGGPVLFLLGVLLLLFVQAGAALDALRQRTARSPTWPRTLAVAVAGFCLAAGLKSLARRYFVESFRVPGNSMYPSLLAGDQVLASKVDKTPRRGDVIVYRNTDGTAFIKRVTAVEWDRIEIRDNVVWINGQNLQQEPNSIRCTIEDQCILVSETNAGHRYGIALSTKTSTLNPKPELRVPMGQMFILGDARRWSLDSRMTGPVPAQSTIGTAKFVWWPPARFGLRP